LTDIKADHGVAVVGFFVGPTQYAWRRAGISGVRANSIGEIGNKPSQHAN